MIRPTVLLHTAALGTLRGVFAIGTALAYLQAIVALAIIAAGVALVVRLFV